jgi:hypothetical protein
MMDSWEKATIIIFLIIFFLWGVATTVRIERVESRLESLCGVVQGIERELP